MLDLDGSAGGGQLVRTALSLSAVTGTPFAIDGVRGDRSTPGLRAQHLACVEALAAVTDAAVGAGADGDGEPAVGTDRLVFEPNAVAGGEHAVDIGTAGSVALLVDAVLPVATALEAPLRLTVRGGTDVAWSPPVDYLRHIKLPLLRRRGLGAALAVHRRGFYPEGGGAVTLHLAPSTLSPVRRTTHGSATAGAAAVYSTASADLADAEVAERQAAEAADLLADDGLEVVTRSATHGATRSTGSALVVALGDPETDPDPAAGRFAGFSALGEPGKPAEDVAGDAVAAARDFRDGPGAVDRHMADQLVPYLALAGGEVAIPRVTDHVETCAALVGEFGLAVEIERRAAGTGGAVLSA